MKADYIDGSGEVVGWIESNQLFTAKGDLIGNIDQNGDVICPKTGETLAIVFHEGLYKGPRQPPFAWLKDSEFKT